MAEIPGEISQWRQVEREYFASLANLAALYNFSPLNVSREAYPLNLCLSRKHAEAVIQKHDPDLHLVIVQDEKRNACLATVKVYDTQTTLYYLPVRPLFDLLGQKRKKEAHLLLSVFAYLFRVVCLPYYAGYNDFLETTYMMIENFLTEEPENYDADEFAACLSEIRMAEYGGRKVLRQIRHPYHLEQFEARVQQFTPENGAQCQLWECCNKFLRLYRDFPLRRYYDNIEPLFLNPQVEERIEPEQYVSFVWSLDGWLADNLMEHVNYSLQELYVAEEPLSFQYFDRPQESISHDFSFETTLFNLLDELAEVLNTII